MPPSRSPPQLLRHYQLIALIHPDIHSQLDPLEAGVCDADELQRGEGPPRRHSQDVALLGVVDVQPVLAQHADLEGDLVNLMKRLPEKQPQGIQQIEDRINSRPPCLELAGRDP